MKSTGIVRKVDELGRIVIPIEIRRIMDIDEKDALEIFTDNDRIILQKYAPGCSACGAVGVSLKQIGKVQLCDGCLQDASQEI